MSPCGTKDIVFVAVSLVCVIYGCEGMLASYLCCMISMIETSVQCAAEYAVATSFSPVANLLVFHSFSTAVLIHEPWPTSHVLVPIGSNVEIRCTAVDAADPPHWVIDLAAEPHRPPIQFHTGRTRLNAHGVYELPTIVTPLTLRLLINETAVNNRTEIICDSSSGAQFNNTVLYVFGEFGVN